MTDTYVTITGDMWDGIAYKVFGDETYMDKIIKKNPQYREIVIFSAGVTLQMPMAMIEAAAELPPWKRGLYE